MAALGEAESFVRDATALALGAVSPETAAGGASATSRAELWAYDGSTGVVRRMSTARGGAFEVLSELRSGVTGSRAALAVVGGRAVLAVAGSPWRFFTVDLTAPGAVAEPIEVPGTWQGSLALLPARDTVRAIGYVSEGAIETTAAWAVLRSGAAAEVHLLPKLPVRDGLWLGYGSDGDRQVVLAGGGTDGNGSAHGDVYAVDLERLGATELVAPDTGATGLGADAWVTGIRAESGWKLRLVPARSGAQASVRFGAYTRDMSFDRGWAPAGLSAHNTPRGDVTTAARLARGSSCERANTPWYAPPGVLAFDDDSTHPLLRCEQLIPQRGSEATLPRQVGAYALGDGYVWTVSRFGLERWDLTGVSPVLTATFAALGAKPNANPGAVLAASDTLVAVGLGSHLTVLGAVADGAFASLGGVELCDDVVGLHAGRDDIWAVGKRHVTHVRLADGALAVVGTFELMRLSVEDGGAGDDDGHDHGGHHGDQHQRGDHGDDDDEHEHRHGDHEPGDHGDDTLGIFAHPLAADTCGGTRSPGQVVSASAAGAVLAIAFEHHLVTLDLRKPSRLPTFAWQPFEQKLTDVGTDGRFTYAHTNGAPSWYAFRASPRNALDPTGVEPAHGFAQGRSYRGRYAARLTGVALRVAVGGAP